MRGGEEGGGGAIGTAATKIQEKEGKEDQRAVGVVSKLLESQGSWGVALTTDVGRD